MRSDTIARAAPLRDQQKARLTKFLFISFTWKIAELTQRGLRMQRRRNTIHEYTRNDTKHFVLVCVVSWILFLDQTLTQKKEREFVS